MKINFYYLLSFDHFGITSKNLTDYGSQLRHFFRTNQVEDVVPIDRAISANNCERDESHKFAYNYFFK